MIVPFESAVTGSLEGSRGGRAHVPTTCRADDHTNRVTPLSGTQLRNRPRGRAAVGSPRATPARVPQMTCGLSRQLPALTRGFAGRPCRVGVRSRIRGGATSFNVTASRPRPGTRPSRATLNGPRTSRKTTKPAGAPPTTWRMRASGRIFAAQLGAFSRDRTLPNNRASCGMTDGSASKAFSN